MRAAVLHGTAGSLLLTGLVAVPAGGAPAWPGQGGSAEARGTAVAAQRAAAAGIRFGTCAKVEHLPSNLQCGTVTVPLDYALPDGKRIRLTVSRVRATGKDPRNAKHKVPRQGALVYNPGGPGASGMYFPLIGFLPHGSGSGPRTTSSATPRAGSTAPRRCPAGTRGARRRHRRSHRRSPRRRTRRRGSRRRRRTPAAAPGVRVPPCATTPRSTTPATWTCCAPRSVSGS